MRLWTRITLLLALLTLWAGVTFAYTGTVSYSLDLPAQLGQRPGMAYNVYAGPGPTNIDTSAPYYTYVTPPLSGGYSPNSIHYLVGLRRAEPYQFPVYNWPTYYSPFWRYPFTGTYGGCGTYSCPSGAPVNLF